MLVVQSQDGMRATVMGPGCHVEVVTNMLSVGHYSYSLRINDVYFGVFKKQATAIAALSEIVKNFGHMKGCAAGMVIPDDQDEVS